jgi:hypothetical protein
MSVLSLMRLALRLLFCFVSVVLSVSLLRNACCPIKDTSRAPQAVNGTVLDPFELVGVGFCDVLGCFGDSSCASMLLDQCNSRLGLNSVTDRDHARNWSIDLPNQMYLHYAVAPRWDIVPCQSVARRREDLFNHYVVAPHGDFTTQDCEAQRWAIINTSEVTISWFTKRLAMFYHFEMCLGQAFLQLMHSFVTFVRRLVVAFGHLMVSGSISVRCVLNIYISIVYCSQSVRKRCGLLKEMLQSWLFRKHDSFVRKSLGFAVR